MGSSGGGEKNKKKNKKTQAFSVALKKTLDFGPGGAGHWGFSGRGQGGNQNRGGGGRLFKL